jgi:hypothetical protein
VAVSEHAAAWADVAVRVLRTPYPYATHHMSLGPDDVDVTPERLHPAFHGALDWHSSAHMQWSLVRLLTLAPAALGGDGAAATELLDQRLSPEGLQVEAAYLRGAPSFERPYGWAWAAALAAATRQCPNPAARRWEQAMGPVADAVADLVLGWLPRQVYPVRHGVHSNTAFAMSLLLEAYESLGRPDVADALRRRATDWFGSDVEYATRWEPSGSDFLSPALCELELMRRVLPRERFPAWARDFLPGLAEGERVELLATPEVADRTDGHLVHLFGLALSRAWQLRELAATLDGDDGDGEDTGGGRAAAAQLRAAADAQVAAVLPEVTGGDFMSTHWLVSFALLAESAGESARESTGKPAG